MLTDAFALNALQCTPEQHARPTQAQSANDSQHEEIRPWTITCSDPSKAQIEPRTWRVTLYQ